MPSKLTEVPSYIEPYCKINSNLIPQNPTLMQNNHIHFQTSALKYKKVQTQTTLERHESDPTTKNEGQKHDKMKTTTYNGCPQITYSF